jgi:hypothetical protein
MLNDEKREISRHPPADVVRYLRKEVNYSCPICGLPFLSWHHFDPPFHVRAHHDLAGMIALCPGHHKMADSGVYTVAQLRELKREGMSKNRVAFRWPWIPENIAFIFGGSILFGARPALTIDGSTILGARRGRLAESSDFDVLFDLNLKTREGKPIARMEENLFEALTPDLEDFVFTPGTNVFGIEHTSGTKLKLEFHRYTPAKFRLRVRDILPDGLKEGAPMEMARSFATDNEGKIPAVTITGTILTHDVTLKARVRDLQMKMHCYNEEEAIFKGMLFAPTGTLKIVYRGREVIKFG